MSEYAYFRIAPEGKYRVIEIDPGRQWWGEKAAEETEYTSIIGDFSDWDQAVAALGELSHAGCRRQMWAERGIAGENNRGKTWAYYAFR